MSSVRPAEQRTDLAETVLGAGEGRVVREGWSRSTPRTATPIPGCHIWILGEHVTNLNFKILVSELQVPTANLAVACGVRPTYLAQS